MTRKLLWERYRTLNLWYDRYPLLCSVPSRSLDRQSEPSVKPVSLGNSIEFNDDLPLFRFIGFDSCEAHQRTKSEIFACYSF